MSKEKTEDNLSKDFSDKNLMQSHDRLSSTTNNQENTIEDLDTDSRSGKDIPSSQPMNIKKPIDNSESKRIRDSEDASAGDFFRKYHRSQSLHGDAKTLDEVMDSRNKTASSVPGR